MCVYCGSQIGANPEFRRAAEELGRAFAQQQIGLVYGGGSIGLMGVLADAVLQQGGHVTGVIPEFLSKKEVRHDELSELIVVPDMHTRKARMAALADAFLALPGGYGTFEELFEVITWSQLGLHRKPIGLLNTASFFDPLLQMLTAATTTGFIRSPYSSLLQVADSPGSLLDDLLRRLPHDHSDSPDPSLL